MKSINIYINEKLHINKDISAQNNIGDEDLSSVKIPHLQNPKSSDIQKMREYRSKGSKPQRLVASIKDRDKLERRFVQAIIAGWDEATDVFGDEIVKRGYYSKKEIDAYKQANDYRYKKYK